MFIDGSVKEQRRDIVRNVYLDRNCIAENFKKGETAMKTCIECFGKLGNLFNSEGKTNINFIKNLKSCTTEFLPETKKFCATDLENIGSRHDGKPVQFLTCFRNIAAKVGNSVLANECLAGKSSVDLAEAFTNGIICFHDTETNMLDLWEKLRLFHPSTSQGPSYQGKKIEFFVFQKKCRLARKKKS